MLRQLWVDRFEMKALPLDHAIPAVNVQGENGVVGA
jgi:hypothetical protein